MKIKLGEIPAKKLNGPKGPQYFVFPEGLPPEFLETDISLQPASQQADITDPDDSHQADNSLAEGFHQANLNVASLIKANQEIMAKLESAIYRNGYLDAQLEAERSQVRLLTDSLHQAKAQTAPTETVIEEPKQTWWQKFFGITPKAESQ